ncbi:unnamed protein product [Brachionus calyciflorus]|uniref:Multidrug and toxin extrusion protein n=1 Tax=Brachionus calyciflorus TaxID=104777 RepID=A0A813ZET3_9BILA|nr:unnamed protein product [Brachionus calyciflorus]
MDPGKKTNENFSIETDHKNQRNTQQVVNSFKSEILILASNSVPLILTNFSQTFLPIISLFFCGHIGPNELAAVTLANTFINIGSFSSLVGLSSACDTLFPQLFGSVDRKKVGSVLQKGLLISILSCLPTGGSISVVLSNFCILLIVVLYLLQTELYKPTWSGWKVDCLFDWTEYLKLAIPGFAMLFFEWTNFEIGVIAAGKLERDDISVMSIGIQTIYIAFMIPLGIAISANIRIGQFLGEQSPDKAIYSCKVGFVLALIACFLTSAVIFVCSNYIPIAFTSKIEIIKTASKLLKFLAFAHLLDAMQGYAGGVIKAIGAQFYGFIMVIISFYLIGIPVGIYLLLRTHYRVTGYWIGFTLAATILLIMQAIFIYEIDWHKNARKSYERSILTETTIEKNFASYIEEHKSGNALEACDIVGASACPHKPDNDLKEENFDEYCNKYKSNIECIYKKYKGCDKREKYVEAMESMIKGLKKKAKQISEDCEIEIELVDEKPKDEKKGGKKGKAKDKSHDKKEEAKQSKTTEASDDYEEEEKVTTTTGVPCRINLISTECHNLLQNVQFNPNWSGVLKQKWCNSAGPYHGCLKSHMINCNGAIYQESVSYYEKIQKYIHSTSNVNCPGGLEGCGVNANDVRCKMGVKYGETNKYLSPFVNAYPEDCTLFYRNSSTHYSAVSLQALHDKHINF